MAKEDPTDIYYVPDFQEVHLRFDDIARLNVVSEAYALRGFFTVTPGLQDLEITAPSTALPARFFKLLEGRIPDPQRADEVMISFRARDRFHWHVGSRLSITLAGPGDPEVEPTPGPLVTVRIVGIEAASGELVSIAGPGMTTSPAFERLYAARAGSIQIDTFKLRRGHADVPAFDAGVRKLSGGQPVLYVDIASDLAQVKRSFHLQGLALWLMCAVVGAVSFLIFAQSIARQSAFDADEYPVLRALGLTQTELAALGIIRALIVAVAAALVAFTSGILLSFATPFGLARVIEPHPGPWIAGGILASGCGILAAMIVACAAYPSWRAASPRLRGSQNVRPTVTARALGFISARPAPALGARFALEQGRGRTAVPVRSSLTAAVIGIVVLLASLSVGVSVKHFAATPRLYGWTWDVAFDGHHNVSFESGSKAREALIADSTIRDASVGGLSGATFLLNGIAMDGITLDPIKGNLEPNVLQGRTPTGQDEVAVGRKSLEQAGAQIGSVVNVGLAAGGTTIPMRVVGVAVFPFDDDTSTVGEGLWMTAQALHRIFPSAPPDSAAIRFAPGVHKAAAIQRLSSLFDGEFTEAVTPGGVTDYRRVSQVPLVLAGILGALAVGTLAHLLVSSIRRRRRDLAILKSLGFEKRQAWSVVLWQAGIFTAVVLAIAVPLGVIAGRALWRVIANYGGFDPAPIVPLSQFGIACAAALGVALAIAVLPARAAARTPAAVVLRTE